MFRDHLVNRATAEWEYFGKDKGDDDHQIKIKGISTDKETAEPFATRVGDYWLSIDAKDYANLVENFAKKKGKLDGTVRKLPWSAAFISYCMQMAGAGTEFPYAPGHATWIVKSIKNKTAKKTSAPLVGYRPGEEVVKIGDLVGNTRKKGVTYDNAVATGWFISHTDIVVEVDTAAKLFRTIGGNVGQSVSQKTFNLDKDGKIASGSGLLVHIRNNITGETKISAALAAKTVNVG